MIPSTLDTESSRDQLVLPGAIQPTNLIFLNLDGVLNCDRTIIGLNINQPLLNVDEEMIKMSDRVAVELINNLTERAKAKIIISSSHQQFFRNRNKDFSMEKLESYVKRLGLSGDVIGATPSLISSHPSVAVQLGEYTVRLFRRGIEIKIWLEQWLSRGNKVDRYLIIDDSPNILDEQLNNFVKTCPINGFLVEHYYVACKILKLSFGANNVGGKFCS